MTQSTAPPANAGPALDPNTFAGLLELIDGDDTSFVVELFETYVRSYRDCVTGLKRAVTGTDADALRTHAHTLKGASANVGASHIAELAETLQRLGEAGEVEPAPDWVAAIAEEYERVLVAVQERLPEFQVPA